MFQRSTIHASDISLFCITTTALLVVANDGLQVTDMSSTKRQQRAPGRTPLNRLDDIIYIRVPQDLRCSEGTHMGYPLPHMGSARPLAIRPTDPIRGPHKGPFTPYGVRPDPLP
jgi:hypothetical protein